MKKIAIVTMDKKIKIDWMEAWGSNIDWMEDCPTNPVQNALNGAVERIRIKKGLDMYVNADGAILELPQNRLASVLSSRYTVGNVVFCGYDEDGDPDALTRDDAIFFETLSRGLKQ